MKKQSMEEKRKRNIFGVITLVFLFVVVIAAVLVNGHKEEMDNGVLAQIRNQNGYIRTVGSEEYEFYKKLVDRDLPEDISEEELEQKTKEKINRTNAEFMLANRMGICGPYSFESFQRDMEIENNQRKLKKERNEVFYGPEQFDLTTYYNYITTNQKLDMVSFITQNMDAKMLDLAEKYYNEHKEIYKTIKELKYLLTEENQTEERTVISEELSSLEKTDSTLFEFLYYGKSSDTMQYSYGNILRDVQIMSIEYEEQSFENNMERVVRDYITNIYLEEWLQEIEADNPVEFKLS